MIDCPNGELRDQLPDYLHDRVSPTERATVEAHLAACTSCAAELTLLRELRGALDPAPRVDVATIVAALPRASGQVAGRATMRGREARWRRVDWRVAAAIVILAAGGSATAILIGAPQRREDAMRIAGATSAVQQVASTGVTMDAYTSDATVGELEALLDELDTFDGLPAGEPEPSVAAPGDAEGGL